MKKYAKRFFALLLSLILATVTFRTSVFSKNVSVPCIDILIKPEAFQKMLLESNKGTEYPVSLTVDNISLPASVRTRGNSSYREGLITPAKRLPYEIIFEKNMNIGEIKNVSSLKLNNSFSLYRLIAEYTALKIYEHMGVPVSETEPVFISFNSVDYGLYLGIEDVDKTFVQKRFGADALQYGNLYKSVDITESTVIDENYFSTSFFGTLQFKCGNRDHKTLKAFLTAVETGGDFIQYLDIDKVIRFFACTAASGGTDTLLSTVHNVFLYENKGKISFIPWDLSLAFDCFDDNQSILPDDQFSTTNDFFDILMETDEYKEKYCAYIEEIRETFLNPDISTAFINDFLKSVGPFYSKDHSMIFDKKVTTDNITSGNSLVDGNILLAISETYRQLGEQITGEADHFYTPKNLYESVYSLYHEEDLFAYNGADFLNKIKNNYWKAHLFSSDGTMIIVCSFAVLLVFMFLSHGKSKGRRRKRR